MPLVESPMAEHTLARKRLNKMFQSDIDISMTIHFETDKMLADSGGVAEEEFDDFTVYEVDTLLKRKIGLPQLTAARIMCSIQNKKVFFGAPDSIIAIEDLCARLSLEELEAVFLRAVHQYD